MDKLMGWLRRVLCRHNWQRSYADYEAGKHPHCDKCGISGEKKLKAKYDIIIDGVRYVKCNTH